MDFVKIEKLFLEIDNVKRADSIKTYKDIEVFIVSYKASIIVSEAVLKFVPSEEKYGLTSQLSRSSKAIPRLIAEGYSKSHQERGFQKYLDDALAESNECIVSLQQCFDFYLECLNENILLRLIALYERISKQIYTMRFTWKKG